ncbi:MAG: carbohydrate-binding protein [Marinagarivorans sp.]
MKSFPMDAHGKYPKATIPLTLGRTISNCLIAGSLLLGSGAWADNQFKTLKFLNNIRGVSTLGGLHNRQPNSDPNVYSRQLNAATGLWPALYSADFLFEGVEISNRQKMIDQVKVEWSHGAAINLMWHACNPAKSEPCEYSKAHGTGPWSDMSDAEWAQLMTDGSAINTEWKRRMDKVAVFLAQLQQLNIEVMFRPLHEMNQRDFWWGGRPGPNGTAKLYRMTHDYFTNTKGLKNLIWVWDVQDFGSLASDLNTYDPGSNYWDVLALDVYRSDGQGFSQQKYNLIANKAAGKPIGIGECDVLPSPAELNAQPLWAFFMGWSELVFKENDTQKINNVYGSGRVLTLNELPGWNNVTVPGVNPNPAPAFNGITVQAEDYANMSGVAIEDTSDSSGGLDVGAIDTGDWLSFSGINIPATGNYTVSFRVASPVDTGRLQFEQAGAGKIYGAPFTIPNTGDWQNWTTISQVIWLDKGVQDFGIKALAGDWNINWFSIAPLPAATIIQAENYTNMSGVVSEPTSDTGGGFDIGGIDTGDWLSFSRISVPVTGTYTLELRVASPTGGRIQFEQAGGGTIYAAANIPATGGWQNWQSVKINVNLTAGVQDFGIKAVQGNWNFNWWSLTPVTATH